MDTVSAPSLGWEGQRSCGKLVRSHFSSVGSWLSFIKVFTVCHCFFLKLFRLIARCISKYRIVGVATSDITSRNTLGLVQNLFFSNLWSFLEYTLASLLEDWLPLKCNENARIYVFFHQKSQLNVWLGESSSTHKRFWRVCRSTVQLFLKSKLSVTSHLQI